MSALAGPGIVRQPVGEIVSLSPAADGLRITLQGGAFQAAGSAAGAAILALSFAPFWPLLTSGDTRKVEDRPFMPSVHERRTLAQTATTLGIRPWLRKLASRLRRRCQYQYRAIRPVLSLSVGVYPAPSVAYSRLPAGHVLGARSRRTCRAKARRARAQICRLGIVEKLNREG